MNDVQEHMGAAMHIKDILQHSHLAFNVEEHKSLSVGDPTLPCYLSGHIGLHSISSPMPCSYKFDCV
jgi:hypothetical protein